MTRQIRHLAAAAVVVSFVPAAGGAQSPASDPGIARARESAARTVARIQRADHEGDRAALQRLYDELAPHTDVAALASRVRYWRGFALSRRAINGIGDSADPADLGRDLQQALREFEESLARDPAFVDAKVGAIWCLQTLTFLNRTDQARVQELVPRFVQLLKEGLAAAPDNPRLLWVQGGSQWWTPPDMPAAQVKERHAAALATYRKGLELARKQKGRTSGPLEPAWGEPELLMSLAWSNLNETPPDVRAAEQYASDALALVPYWHYVRDILMPQIRRAKASGQPHNRTTVQPFN